MNLPPEEHAQDNSIQISDDTLPEWRRLIRKSPLAAELLMLFIERIMEGTNAIMISHKTMMELTGKSRAPISKAIKTLEDDHWIQAIKIGNGHAYVVNERVTWQNDNGIREFAFFNATVVASDSEKKEQQTDKLKDAFRFE